VKKAATAYFCAVVLGSGTCAAVFWLFGWIEFPQQSTGFFSLLRAALSWLPLIGLILSPVVALGVGAARSLNLIRPLTDIVFGGVLSVLAWLTIQIGLLESSIGNALALSLLALAPGCVAGYAYWYFAGRPRPPYADLC
jgi:hypothetical protein